MTVRSVRVVYKKEAPRYVRGLSKSPKIIWKVASMSGGKNEMEIKATVVKYTHGGEWYRWITPV